MSSAPHLTSFNAKDALDAGFCLSTLSVDHDVHHALSEFKRLSVYSLPVVDKEGVCLGLVDLGDMVFHLVSCFFKSANVATPEQLVSVSTTELDGVTIEAAFNSTPIATLLNCSGANQRTRCFGSEYIRSAGALSSHSHSFAARRNTARTSAI